MKSKFKIGDSVMIVDENDFYYGRTGTVKKITEKYGPDVYTVCMETGAGGSISSAYNEQKLKGMKK